MLDEPPEDESLPLWECVDCGTWIRSHVLTHDDTGGHVVTYGPDCPECECPMDFVEDPANP